MMRPLSSSEHDAALSSGIAVLVFRWSESPACQQFQPELDKFVAQHPECPVWTVEAVEQKDLSELHHLRALPSIVVYRDGLPARRFAGSMSADDLAASVDEVSQADMQEEYNDWVLEMIEMLDTGEAGSPFVTAPQP
ncbi:thioredoxin [Micromonospora pisi]|uniref:Thioredoxin n=1 Tax=Micromonospora pisi TaxID=589240 RepID=A0A495JSI2_9ACTN|nr:thioredoxin family protein [Micromonospora pisi]RKR91322.1 thioredoxin [Micromonospora pisi]